VFRNPKKDSVVCASELSAARSGCFANGTYGDCGDCMTESYFFGMPGRIAEIALVVDDRGVNSRVCDLRRAVLSFRWQR
jgi:hypothetical protein